MRQIASFKKRFSTFKITFIIMAGIGIFYGLYLCSFSVLHGDIGYNTDIARDLLVLQDIVTTHRIPLIGPHTGGIGGLFHGPLWYYISLPAYIIGRGNPVAIGWFWVVLVICSIAIAWWVGKKLFNVYTGLIAGIFVAFISVHYASAMLNPAGAIVISPLAFYFFYRYLHTPSAKYLLATLLIVGCIIQFEVAFGGPLLLYTFVVCMSVIFRRKKYTHLFAFFILLIPFSTYLVFDIRHHFLQLQAVLHHTDSSLGNTYVSFANKLNNRLDGFRNAWLFTYFAPSWFGNLFLIILGYIGIKCWMHRSTPHRLFFLLFIGYYLVYWPLSFYLDGYVSLFHTLPFITIGSVVFASSYHILRKEIVAVGSVCLLFFYINIAHTTIASTLPTLGTAPGSWLFHYHLAQRILLKSHGDVGLYIFTPDEFGYTPRYAFIYTNREFPSIHIAYNTKQPTTILVMAPPETGANNNGEWWIKNRVKISSRPERVVKYANGYHVLTYHLTPEERKIPSDPNLINGLFFR